MIVIHVYSVLGVTHVDAYVPAGTPAVGEPMPADRQLGRSETLPDARGMGSAVLDGVEQILEQMQREGRDLEAVVDA